MSEEELTNETDWIEYTTKDGVPFYFNKKLKNSVWKMPEDYK